MRLALADAAGRVIRATGRPVRPPPPVRWILPDGAAPRRQRWISSTPGTTSAALADRYGSDLGRAIVDGDPELDLLAMGRPVAPRQGYADGYGRLTLPSWAEIDPDGARRPLVRRAANVADPDRPIRWSGRIPVDVAARRYQIGRVVQVYPTSIQEGAILSAIAAQLAGVDVAILSVGDGEPLVWEDDGIPGAALLYGDVDGSGRYRVAILGIRAALRISG